MSLEKAYINYWDFHRHSLYHSTENYFSRLVNWILSWLTANIKKSDSLKKKQTIF